jgi:hypothetical protein
MIRLSCDEQFLRRRAVSATLVRNLMCTSTLPWEASAMQAQQISSKVSIGILIAGALVAPLSVIAQDAVKACALLTPEDLSIVGIRVTAKGLFPDDSVLLKKGQITGLVTDLRMDQCTSAMDANFAAFPVRWSVATAKEAIDKKTWDQMNVALDAEEKKQPDPAAKAIKIDGVDCETFSWLEKKAGKRIYAINCGALKGKRLASLEFAHSDSTKLPPALAVKQLLDKLLGRL